MVMEPISVVHELHWHIQVSAPLVESLPKLRGADCHLAKHRLSHLTAHLIRMKSESSNKFDVEKEGAGGEEADWIWSPWAQRLQSASIA